MNEMQGLQKASLGDFIGYRDPARIRHFFTKHRRNGLPQVKTRVGNATKELAAHQQAIVDALLKIPELYNELLALERVLARRRNEEDARLMHEARVVERKAKEEVARQEEAKRKYEDMCAANIDLEDDEYEDTCDKAAKFHLGEQEDEPDLE